MINHLLWFRNERRALKLLPECHDDDGWRTDFVVPGQRVIMQREKIDIDGNVVQKERAVPGFFVTVSLPDLSEDLINLPRKALRVAGEAETGEIVYTAPGIDLLLLENAVVEPVPLGSAYAF